MTVLRVFTGADGAGGNKLGVVREAANVDTARRQQIAADLGFSETVFVEPGGQLQIFTPAVELPFAGHPVVGAAWLLRLEELHTPAGPVEVRLDGGRAFVRAPAEFAPPWELRQVESVEALEALNAEGTYSAWTWKDEQRGLVRARVFAEDYGIREDPATGSAAMRLCAQLGRPIAVEQIAGSEILCVPLDGGRIELGGWVFRDSWLSRV